MPRVECSSCKRLISGYELRCYSVEYAFCDRCHRSKVQRLDSTITSLETALSKCREEEKQMKVIAGQAQFLASWDAEMLAGGGHSDFRLRAADGPDVLAHKAVLAGKSPVFKAMLNAPMKEALTGVVVIDDLSHEVLEAFVRFLYTATVSPEVLRKDAASLFCAAVKYDIKLLKSVCEEFLVNNVSRDNAITLLELARKYDSENVKDAVLRAAYMDVDKLSTFGDYNVYFEKDPKLLVELYEGLVRRMSRKRSRFNPDDGGAESSRAKLAARSNGSEAEEVGSSSSP